MRRQARFIEKTLSFDKVFSGGRGWIRTTEVTDDRFTVCSLWPLGNSSICKDPTQWLEPVKGLEPPTC